MAPATFIFRGGAGAMAVSRSGVQVPLISLGSVGNRHRLKPRPPVADGPLPALAGRMIKAITGDLTAVSRATRLAGNLPRNS